MSALLWAVCCSSRLTIMAVGRALSWLAGTLRREQEVVVGVLFRMKKRSCTAQRRFRSREKERIYTPSQSLLFCPLHAKEATSLFKFGPLSERTYLASCTSDSEVSFLHLSGQYHSQVPPDPTLEVCDQQLRPLSERPSALYWLLVVKFARPEALDPWAASAVVGQAI